MRASDFFKDEQDPSWSMNGDPWSSWRKVLDVELIESVRRGQVANHPDWAVAQGLSRLVHRELEAYGTGGGQELDDEQIVEALRALRAVLGRIGIKFSPPFRDFGSFHAYWVKEEMGYSYAARRGYLNTLFSPIWDRLDEVDDEQSRTGGFRGVDGQPLNLIFASNGLKPEFVLLDAINNVIEVVENGESCLFYDRELTPAGLTWGDLVTWWREKRKLTGLDDRAVGHDLYRRLRQSLKLDTGEENPAELLVFNSYCARYQGEAGLKRPVLLPQVYLQYDPLTKRQRQTLRKGDRLKRERMDFLLMLPGGVRVVIEVDGKQHYAKGDVASAELYAEMVAEDRALRLRGYEVYRFGGYELMQKPDAPAMVQQFFDELDELYGTNAVGEPGSSS